MNMLKVKVYEAVGQVPELDMGLEQVLAVLAECHCLVSSLCRGLWVDTILS